ncbi:hypothetical protein MHBO_000458 [Bonamia ostreae]|uniref:U3 small nucleolar RNA-associated protein 20 domain-containing protein n=1 Tax=Bonamia ostreae TaxID=126728 RepID=A0ABV2AGB5_9EUKA
MKKVLLKGYQKHVLGYSLNSLLSSILEWAEKGSLDDFAPNLVQILLEDIFGRPSEDRSVEKIKYSMKEASSEKSFDSFRILAKMVNFRQSEKGLNLILDNVQKTFFKKCFG